MSVQAVTKENSQKGIPVRPMTEKAFNKMMADGYKPVKYQMVYVLDRIFWVTAMGKVVPTGELLYYDGEMWKPFPKRKSECEKCDRKRT